MATDLVNLTIWVKPELKEVLRRAAFEARQSVSSYAAACLADQHAQTAPEPVPTRTEIARQLAQLGYTADDFGKLSASEIERIVSQRIPRR
jgi:hypothetical protein